ncbi:DUF3990 domain-containing protein [Ureibacillus xyleni]|uniref:DUF3990 domain-containing protein n=1 Tax=Ureibacillus xyleni TaxID=614648 RepID=UPI001379ECF8|nr:DUF3990 domain-containing protein [Ureibacillus xyleni]
MLNDYLFCYHGTIKRYGEYIESNGINLDKSRFATDFGKGFYVTNNKYQAEKWAKIKYQDNIDKFSSEDIKPVVVYFALDINKITGLSGCIFEEPNLDWGNFILDCRKEGMRDGIFHSYDFVLGHLADGKIVALLRRAISGRIDSNEFLVGISPLSSTNTQLSLHTEKSLECIKCLGVKEIEF